MSNTKKKFFRTPTISKIINKPKIYLESDNILEKILNLNDDEAIWISKKIIPEEFPTSQKFLKHGRELPIHNFGTLEKAIKRNILPNKLQEMIVDKAPKKSVSGFTFRPLIAGDQRKRKFNLVEVLEAAKIFHYSHNTWVEPLIKVKPYDSALAVEKDGAEVLVEVPSRTTKHSKYKFKFSGIPIVKNSRKYGLAYSLGTNHTCESKTYNIRYKYATNKESSKIFNFCAHEIAAYYAIINFYKKQNNKVPLQMNVFPIPTETTVKFYNNLTHNCAIQTEGKPRVLNQAEKMIALFALSKELGYRKTLRTTKKLKNYKWK